MLSRNKLLYITKIRDKSRPVTAIDGTRDNFSKYGTVP